MNNDPNNNKDNALKPPKPPLSRNGARRFSTPARFNPESDSDFPHSANDILLHKRQSSDHLLHATLLLSPPSTPIVDQPPLKAISPRHSISILRLKQIKLKESRVNKALILNDQATLRLLALEDLGLVRNHLRKPVYALLLNRHHFEEEKKKIKSTQQHAMDHAQVDLDCNRTFQGTTVDNHAMVLRTFLHDFLSQPQGESCFYFQGFHDFCSCVLLVLGRDIHVAHFVLKGIVSTTLMADFVRETMDVVTVELEMVHFLIEAVNPTLAKRIERALQSRKSVWAVSMLTCFFAHDVSSLAAFARLLDAVLGAESILFPLYLVAAVALTVAELPLESEDKDEELVAVLGALKDSCKHMQVHDADLVVRSARVLELKVPHALLMEHAVFTLKLPFDSYLRSRFVMRSSHFRSFALYTRELF